MEWYYAKDGKQEGPISMAQLRQLASAGRLAPTDMVFKTGTKDWVEASTVAGLFPAARSAPAAPAAAEGGFAFGEEKAAVAPTRRKGARARVENEEEAEDKAEPAFRPRAGGGIPFLDYILFQRTIQSWALPIAFWLIVLGILYSSAETCWTLLTSLNVLGIRGLFWILGVLIGTAAAILMLRVGCEVMRTIFQLHDVLVHNKDELKRQPPG